MTKCSDRSSSCADELQTKATLGGASPPPFATPLCARSLMISIYEETIVVENLERDGELECVNLGNMDRQFVRDKVRKVNWAIGKIETKNTSETNTFLLACANVVAEVIQFRKNH